MTVSRASRRAIAAALVAALLVAPATGQETPESLLPPGFGDAPPEAETPAEPEPRPATPIAPAPAPTPSAIENLAEDDGNDSAAADAPPEIPDPLGLPDSARRDPRYAGSAQGLGEESWGRADGRYLERLMRRLEAPVASRWASILLRRALVGRAAAPTGLNGADWAAERAWLLVRMGEANEARSLIQSVDVDRATPKYSDVAMQAYLATADPVGICPLTGAGMPAKTYAGWELARAWCLALAGDQGTAGSIVTATRRRTGRGIDMLLAEKLVNVGGGRRSTTIEWTGVSALSAWRYGLAVATGVTLPPELLEGAPERVAAWAAVAPMRPLAERVGQAATAARLGVLSNIAYVDLMGAVADATDPAELEGTPAAQLRTAYAATDPTARIAALKALWGEGGGDARFVAQVLTARAAALVAPDAARIEDADLLIGSMLTAGLDTAAARWAGIVAQADAGSNAWAMLAVGTPRPGVDLGAGRVRAYVEAKGAGDVAKARLLVAALAGLGRLDRDEAPGIAQDAGVDLSRRTSWVEAIEAAATAQQPGTVALLAAVGLQAPGWRGVPPVHLFHIVRALSAVGLEAEARMIAAEAIARS